MSIGGQAAEHPLLPPPFSEQMGEERKQTLEIPKWISREVRKRKKIKQPHRLFYLD
jgi:hypothetical protein